MNKVYLSSDPVYYNNKFGQVLRHCNYENGEMLEMAPSVQCPAFTTNKLKKGINNIFVFYIRDE